MLLTGYQKKYSNILLFFVQYLLLYVKDSI